MLWATTCKPGCTVSLLPDYRLTINLPEYCEQSNVRRDHYPGIFQSARIYQCDNFGFEGIKPRVHLVKPRVHLVKPRVHLVKACVNFVKSSFKFAEL